MNRLDSASSWLEGVRKAHASNTVSYQVGDEVIENVSATPGMSEFYIDDGNGGSLKVEAGDYLILAADLMLNDDLVEPQRGHRIIDGANVYEVNAPPGEQCWQWSDSYGRTRRIHTMRLGTV